MSGGLFESATSRAVVREVRNASLPRARLTSPRRLALPVSSSAIENPNIGDLFFNQTTGIAQFWNGEVWVPFGQGDDGTFEDLTVTGVLTAAGPFVAENGVSLSQEAAIFGPPSGALRMVSFINTAQTEVILDDAVVELNINQENILRVDEEGLLVRGTLSLNGLGNTINALSAGTEAMTILGDGAEPWVPASNPEPGWVLTRIGQVVTASWGPTALRGQFAAEVDEVTISMPSGLFVPLATTAAVVHLTGIEGGAPFSVQATTSPTTISFTNNIPAATEISIDSLTLTYLGAPVAL
jgi:hypothetical protein